MRIAVVRKKGINCLKHFVDFHLRDICIDYSEHCCINLAYFSCFKKITVIWNLNWLL
jgi:hypothetical protein